MSKFQHDVMLKIVKIIDLVMITIPFALCWELYYSYQVYAKFGWKGNWAMIGLFAVLFFCWVKFTMRSGCLCSAFQS